MAVTPPAGERQGIFGLETEHAILYLPEDDAPAAPAEPPAVALPSGDRPADRPSFDLIQRVIFECLLAGRKAAVSSGIKGGYFLENGGLAHVELYLRTPSDSPILEVATPECRSPWDVVAYSRAYDEILEETSRRSAGVLASQGFRGRIAFGKNNQDVAGVGFGCHENYLVHGLPGKLEYIASLFALPVIFLSFIPTFILILMLLSAAAVVFLAVKLIEKAVPSVLSGAVRAYAWLVRRHSGFIGYVRMTYFILTNIILYPAIILYSLFLRWVAFRPFLRHLSPFLATRSILAGAGHLDFRRGAYELSQRARLTRTLAEIVMFGRWKTVFDLKGFLFDPMAFYRPTKKLTIACGDSNLSDASNLLKIGTTALVIEMIEAGTTFDDLRLARPVSAMKKVSADGPWKKLHLRSGRSLVAIDIQRAYLERARAFFRGRPEGRFRHGEILTAWEDVMEKLADRPQSLAGSLDWAAKKSLLDRAVLPNTNWKVFFAWGRLFDAAGMDASAAAQGIEDLLARTPLFRRIAARRLASAPEIEAAEFEAKRDLYFQARKIDFRFHEIGCGEGYQRRLERDGWIARLVDDAAVARAVREPPPDTRARVRGYYIQKSTKPEALQVNWNEIDIVSPARHIPTPDPFHHGLPE